MKALIIIAIMAILLVSDKSFYDECFGECCGLMPRSECLIEIRDIKILARVAVEFEDKFGDKEFAEKIKKEVQMRLRVICPVTTRKYYGEK